jgi:accessory gene regulator B
VENRWIHALARYLAGKVNAYAHKDDAGLQKIVFGAEIFIINISKLIIIYALALILGTVWQTIIVHAAYMITKRYSFGLHALNSTVCTAVSCFMFVLTPLLLNELGMGNAAAALVFSAIIIILYRFAPADTKAWPLVGEKRREIMKRKAVLCGTALMVTAMLVPNGSVKLLLAMGAAYQCLAVLPLTYKILKRSVKNYEAYE